MSILIRSETRCLNNFLVKTLSGHVGNIEFSKAIHIDVDAVFFAKASNGLSSELDPARSRKVGRFCGIESMIEPSMITERRHLIGPKNKKETLPIRKCDHHLACFVDDLAHFDTIRTDETWIYQRRLVSHPCWTFARLCGKELRGKRFETLLFGFTARK